jgi:hypothetical protein
MEAILYFSSKYFLFTKLHYLGLYITLKSFLIKHYYFSNISLNLESNWKPEVFLFD